MVNIVGLNGELENSATGRFRRQYSQDSSLREVVYTRIPTLTATESFLELTCSPLTVHNPQMDSSSSARGDSLGDIAIDDVSLCEAGSVY